LCAAKAISTGLGVLYIILSAAVWCMGHRKEHDHAPTQQITTSGGSCSRRGEDPSPLHDCVKYPGRASSVGSVAAEQQARKAKRPCSSGRRKGCAGRSVTRTVLGCWLGWELKRRVTYPRMHAASDDRAVVQACRGWGHGHERTEAGGAGPVGRTKARHIHSPAIAADSPNFPRARSAWEEIGGGWG
jgi:hypothetical protein